MRALLELAGDAVLGEAGLELLEPCRGEELREEKLAWFGPPVERTRVRMSVSLAVVADPGRLEPGRETQVGPELALLVQEDAGEIERV